MKKLLVSVSMLCFALVSANLYAENSVLESLKGNHRTTTVFTDLFANNTLKVKMSPPQACQSGGEWCRIDRDCCTNYICVAVGEGKTACK